MILLLVLLASFAGNAQGQPLDRLIKTSGCCSSHGGVSNQCQSNGKVVCNDGWRGSSCSCEDSDSSSSGNGKGTTSRPKLLGIVDGTFTYQQSLLGDPAEFGIDTSLSRFRFKIRNVRGKLRVSMIQPVPLSLTESLEVLRSAFSSEGTQVLVNSLRGESCLETYLAEFTSVTRTAADVVITHSIDCPSGEGVFVWSGQVRRKK